MRSGLFLVMLSLVFFSCGSGDGKSGGSDKEKSKLEGRIRLNGSAVLSPLMARWATEFQREYPKVKIEVVGGSSGSGMAALAGGYCDVAMISRPLTDAETKQGFNAVPVLSDMVVPIMSFNNPDIQTIVRFGIPAARLKAAFAGELKSWGALAGKGKGVAPGVYYRNDSSGTTAVWTSYLGMEESGIRGSYVVNENMMIEAVANHDDALGYASIYAVYDSRTGFRKNGLYVIPVDFNGNGQADDAELVYDKLTTVKAAMAAKQLPSPPVRELYFVFKSPPSGELTLTFLRWVLGIGQNFADQWGYIPLPRSRADEVLKALGSE